MNVRVLGIKRITSTKTGELFLKLYLGVKEDDVSGYRTFECFLSAKSAPSELKPGDDVLLNYKIGQDGLPRLSSVTYADAE